MPAPFFTTNPAEITRLEGLYIFEKDPPGFIAGVSLSTVAVMGQTVRGPVDQAIEITSPSRFAEVFGGRDYGSGGALANQVWRFLLNKPFGKVVVVRAAAAAAVAASFNAESAAGGAGTEIATISAANAGVWGNDVEWKVEDASDADVNHWNLRIRYLGEETLYENLDTTAGNDNTATVVGDDDATLIALTKLADGRPVNSTPSTDGADAEGYINLGQVVADYTSVAGANGTIAATDYTASGRAFDQIKERKGVAVVSYAEDDATIVAALNTAITTAAAAVSDRMFAIWNGSHSAAVSAVATDAASFRSDRIIYCHNSPYTLDPETALQIQTLPTSWMCSILSQTDVDIHPGEEATKRFTAGITKLTAEDLTREDYITLKEAGVASLERDDGFLFVSGVTTSLTSGKTQITRRRMADFLQLSAADRLKFFVKKKNTPTNRNIIVGELTAFSQSLQDQERVVELYEIDNTTVNTDASRAQGIEKVLWRVRIIGHMLHLVLETEIGTGVTIEAA